MTCSVASNHIYTEIGYQPRCDFRHLTLTW
jgi:predicted GNAT family acetyltransferase